MATKLNSPIRYAQLMNLANPYVGAFRQRNLSCIPIQNLAYKSKSIEELMMGLQALAKENGITLGTDGTPTMDLTSQLEVLNNR